MAGRTGSGGIRSGPLIAMGVGLLLVLAVLVPAASPVAAQDDDPVLYLTERPFENTLDQWNFSVFPADQGEAGKKRQASQVAFPTFLATWTWYLASTPANWSVEAGDEWVFDLFIEGLDQVYPLPLIPPSASLGSYEIRVEIKTEETEYVNGSSEVQVLEVDEGIQGYSVSVTFDEAQDFIVGDIPFHLRVDVSVTGRGEGPESPLYLHYGSNGYASRLTTSKYPVEAFRSMELEFLTKQECQDLILQQKSCENLQGTDKTEDNGTDNGPRPETGTDLENGTGNDRPDAKNTPAAGVLMIVASVLLALAFSPGRRRPADKKD